MAAIYADNISKFIFGNEIIWIVIEISSKFVPKVPINNNTALAQISQYLNQRWSSNMTYICVTRPRWVKIILEVTHFRGNCQLSFRILGLWKHSFVEILWSIVNSIYQNHWVQNYCQQMWLIFATTHCSDFSRLPPWWALRTHQATHHSPLNKILQYSCESPPSHVRRSHINVIMSTVQYAVFRKGKSKRSSVHP